MTNHKQEPLAETPLSERHRSLGARMVPFAGYDMPVQYPTGIMSEHKSTRQSAGLFDVSHMGPSFLELTNKTGDPDTDHAKVAALIEKLVCGDIAGLKPGRMRYTVLLNENGGIVDDLIISRPADPGQSGSLYIVVNAGTKDNDFALITAAAGEEATLSPAAGHALIALQGPAAEAVLSALMPGVEDLGFMSLTTVRWQGGKMLVARAGYTGEDGFEILVPPAQAGRLWDALCASTHVTPVGLGARDSLRLEAGLPLYGHDLDETISPIEAGLGFTVSKRRRERADFPGAARILAERETGPEKIRVGLAVEGAPAREGAMVCAKNAVTTPAGEPVEELGIVTSGGFSPSLGRAIAMAYIPPGHAEMGAELAVKVRNKFQRATVVSMPFVPHR
ncbi:MAG: glycine cleavage system aminomethyltransferase GcvT, partial [Alphaproteobacteria bacterium]|nr:glycine cleavage system aminomethyltransferase GcvT [Alphaproteobacteria bacterium]